LGRINANHGMKKITRSGR